MAVSKTLKNIALVAGGDSGEKVISIASAAVIKQNLDARRYQVYLIRISRGEWVYVPDKGKEIPVDKNDFSIKTSKGKITFDCVFMAIHGTPGEDGRLQAYFDLLGIPYTSCGQMVSALTFNKAYCNKVVQALGANVSKSVHLFRDKEYDVKRILREMKFPVFVKPNNGGSSIGMSKVDLKKDLQAAITKAFKEDHEVLIEEYIRGTEITCGVYSIKGKMMVLPLCEIVPKTEYFDYVAKYKGKSEEIIPARISGEAEILVKSTAAMLYDKLNCSGVVRFDFILSKTGLYFLEVNTVPGMSEASIIPQMVRKNDMSVQDFFTQLIEEGIRKAKAARKK